jgi:hypothetical protein
MNQENGGLGHLSQGLVAGDALDERQVRCKPKNAHASNKQSARVYNEQGRKLRTVQSGDSRRLLVSIDAVHSLVYHCRNEVVGRQLSSIFA